MICSTELFDTYWYFAAERQNIFFARLEKENELTRDEILKSYRFTNSYRASDRVSQFLISNVIYKGDQSAQEVFFRIILFRFFNRISTWQNLIDSFNGDITYSSYDFQKYDRILTGLLENKQKIYSAAYIMPSGVKEFGFLRKHQNNLKLLELMMRDDAPDRIAQAKSLAEVFGLLRAYPTLGDFLAYQYTIDLGYSGFVEGQESDFVIPGPGALRGIEKCFSSKGKMTPSDVIRFVCERQDEEFEKRGIHFKTLFGRPLQLIDCQNLFCEVDKYARAYSPELVIGGRTKIKQRFKFNHEPLSLFYPPKWGINGCIPDRFKINHC